MLEKFEQKPKELSQEERQRALAYLKDPNLIDNISKDLTTAGEIIGENTNKMMLYLAAVSRKFDKPISLVIFGKSSSGKSFLANAVEKFIPDEDKLILSSASQQAFNYLGEQLKHKFVLIQEVEGIEGVLPTIRTLQSEGKLSRLITVKDPEDGTFKARADCQICPCTVVFTTTKETIHDENSTRIFELYADESLEQNRNVVDRNILKTDMKYCNNDAQKKQTLELHQNIQRILEPFKVNIPFAEHLHFPAKSTRNRRDSERFMQLIKAVAFIRQKQKPVKINDGEKYIEADVYDYEIAFKIGIKVIASTLDQISERARNVLRVCCELTDDLKKGGQQLWFTIKQLREKAPNLGLEFSNIQDLYKQLNALTEHEYLDLNQPQARGKKHYCVSFDYVRDQSGNLLNINTPEIKEITTPDELRQKLPAN
jgi:ABC-type dipeptide/oligopeptide/nickel transport system ATPase component